MKTRGMIRIGSRTDLTAHGAMRPFEYAVANGFNAFEWFTGRNEAGKGMEEEEIDAAMRSYIRNMARTSDIALSLHSPERANPLVTGGAAFILRQIGFAKEIGAYLVNIHLTTAEDMEAYAEALYPVIKGAGEADIKLSIENTPLTGPEDFNRLFRLLREARDVPTGRVGICLDLEHADLFGPAGNDYLKFMDGLEDTVPLIHMHMHENYVEEKISPKVEEFVRRIKRRGYAGSIILKQRLSPPSTLNKARDSLYHIFYTTPPERSRGPHPEEEGAEKHESTLTFLTTLLHPGMERPAMGDRPGLLMKLLEAETLGDARERLLYLAIYMRFMGAGHGLEAKTARLIEKRLREMARPADALIMRKIYPSLPPYERAAARYTLFSLIRGLARRGDIPEGLKAGIRQNLGGNLHLSTAHAAPDARCTASSHEEFRALDEKLKEFLDAGFLDELLQAMLRTKNRGEAALIRAFLTAKKEDAGRPEQLIKSLEALTRLREGISKGLGTESGGLRARRSRLAEMALEDHAFVLLGRAVNALQVGPGDALELADALKALSPALLNLQLNGGDHNECQAILNELNSLCEGFSALEREHLLRLKATLERCLRLSYNHVEGVISLFSDKVEKLGRGLGLDEEAISSFLEGDIRGDTAFQLSRLASTLLKKTRAIAALPPWETLAPGRAAGAVVTAGEAGELREGENGRRIALLRHAGGDEDLPEGIAGIILGRAVPHISRLGLAARRRGIVLAVCEDRDRFLELEGLEGEHALLTATADDVRLEVVSKADSRDREGPGPLRTPEVNLKPLQKLFPLREVLLSNGGGKAYSARRLMELSGATNLNGEGGAAGFIAPAGVVIPFGVMEEAIGAAPEFEKEYRLLLGLLDRISPKELTGVLQSMRALTGQLDVPDDIVYGVRKAFPPPTRLIVRSSTNCEDLPGFNMSGLYESVADAHPEEIAEAVRKVWVSLWAERAVISRKKAGIPHGSAHMAVLIQEMLKPDVSFFMHTADPVKQGSNEVYIELAAGLGEPIAHRWVRGTPYRIACEKSTGEVRTLVFASISTARRPDAGGGISRTTVDYSKMALSTDPGARKTLGRRLASVGILVERAFGEPQAIEGAMVGEEIYLVQSRPMQDARAEQGAPR